MHYVKIKRDKIGKCNICLTEGKLTWDHVPPKGSITLTPVEIQTTYQNLAGTKKNKPLIKPKFNEDGVKFRTLCSKCNNSLLGKKYDPILNEFAIGVGRFLNSKLHLPPIINYETKPNAILRAVLGHILASNIDGTLAKYEYEIRDFVLDEKKQLSNEINVFYWVYPYEDISVIRNIAICHFGNNEEPVVSSFLKYFPLAFMVAITKKYADLYSLTRFQHLDTFDTVSIPIDLQNIKESLWPEAPSDDGKFILMGDDGYNSIYAIPRVGNSKNKGKV